MPALMEAESLFFFLSAFSAALMTSMKLVSVVYSARGSIDHPTCACYVNNRLFDGLIFMKTSIPVYFYCRKVE